MNESYVQGFVEKCAELGIDPEALVKAGGIGKGIIGKGIIKKLVSLMSKYKVKKPTLLDAATKQTKGLTRSDKHTYLNNMLNQRGIAYGQSPDAAGWRLAQKLMLDPENPSYGGGIPYSTLLEGARSKKPVGTALSKLVNLQ